MKENQKIKLINKEKYLTIYKSKIVPVTLIHILNIYIIYTYSLHTHICVSDSFSIISPKDNFIKVRPKKKKNLLRACKLLVWILFLSNNHCHRFVTVISIIFFILIRVRNESDS